MRFRGGSLSTLSWAFYSPLGNLQAVGSDADGVNRLLKGTELLLTKHGSFLAAKEAVVPPPVTSHLHSAGR